jgi:hypothetical protein
MANEDNLLLNGGFEEGAKYWGGIFSSDVVKSKEAHSGDWMFKGSFNPPVYQINEDGTDRFIEVEPNRLYRLSCWYKCVGAYGQGVLEINFTDQNNGRPYESTPAATVALYNNDNDTSWRYAETIALTPPSPTLKYMYIQITQKPFGSGTWSLDDFSLTKVNQSTDTPELTLGDNIGTGILRLMSKTIEKDIGFRPLQAPQQNNSTDIYILYGDTNVVAQTDVVNILNVTYTVVSNSLGKSRDTANKIYGIADKLYTLNKFDLLGRPVLNGLNDDTDGAGLYTSTVLLQFAYIRGD